MQSNEHHTAPVRVLIVDDSPVARRLVECVLVRAGVDVVAQLRDGKRVVETARSVRADVVVLDLEMPERLGDHVVADFLEANVEVGILIYSGASKQGLRLLKASTGDRLPCRVVSKGPGAGGGFEGLSDRLVPLVQELGLEVRQRRAFRAEARPPRNVGLRSSTDAKSSLAETKAHPIANYANAQAPDIGLLVIGVSTGGPEALRQVLTELPSDFPIPVAVVQHMPVGFTGQLAKRLDSLCAVAVKEAQTGDVLEPGRVLIARGGEHLELTRSGVRIRATLTQEAPENDCRPAVDVLFRSAAEACTRGVLAVVLTGMGHDGLEGVRHIRAAGGLSIAQDKDTSVVWGMPGAVVKAGLANEVLALPNISARVIELASGEHPSRKVI